MPRFTQLTAALLAADAAAASIPYVTIGKDSSGKDVNLPLVGAGTWQYNNSVAYDSVCKSFEAGYTFVDTADDYGNEQGVGETTFTRIYFIKVVIVTLVSSGLC